VLNLQLRSRLSAGVTGVSEMSSRVPQAGRYLFFGLLAVACVTAGLAIWLSSGADSGSVTKERRLPRLGDHGVGKAAIRDPSSLSVTARAARQLTASFSLLRTPPEPLPKWIRGKLHKPLYGMNWNLAQKLSPTVRDEAWLVPGHGFLCIIAQIGGIGSVCAPIWSATAHGVAVVTLRPRSTTATGAMSRLIIGVAPNGAKEVSAHTGYTTVSRPVRAEGVFVIRDSASNPPDVLTFR
jgi:hypothetical protein